MDTKANSTAEGTPLVIVAIALVTLIVFIAVALQVTSVPGVGSLDLWVNQMIQDLRGPLMTSLALAIDLWFVPAGIISVIALGVVLYLKRRLNLLLLVTFSSLAALSLDYICELAIPRARPPNAMIQVSGNSFPSGHALLATVLFVLLIICFKDSIGNRVGQYLFIAIDLGLIFFISFSRLYLNVHWMSDVVAGIDLGILVIALGVLALWKTGRRFESGYSPRLSMEGRPDGA